MIQMQLLNYPIGKDPCNLTNWSDLEKIFMKTRRLGYKFNKDVCCGFYSDTKKIRTKLKYLYHIIVKMNRIQAQGAYLRDKLQI